MLFTALASSGTSFDSAPKKPPRRLRGADPFPFARDRCGIPETVRRNGVPLPASYIGNEHAVATSTQFTAARRIVARNIVHCQLGDFRISPPFKSRYNVCV
eukprot:1331031-Rhodomonas_salina.1